MKNTYKQLYGYIFKLFTASGLWILPKFNEFRISCCVKLSIMILVNILVYILHLYKGICYLADPDYIFVSIGNLCMIIISCSHRVCLYFKLKNLRNLTKKINYEYEKLNTGTSHSKLYWIRFWASVSILINAIQIGILPVSCLKYNFEYGFNETSIEIFKCVIFATTLILWLLMPLNLFSIYYTVICRQLSYILLEFAKLVSQSQKKKFKSLQILFIEIKRLIKTVDQKVSLFVFLCVIYNAAIMYFAITILLKPRVYGDVFQRSAIYILCANSFVSFLTMVISASDIHQASLLISDNGDAVLEDDQNPGNSQLLFLRTIDKEITMTVWEIVPIKRSFILATIGTLFTYCLLVYNLQLS